MAIRIPGSTEFKKLLSQHGYTPVSVEVYSRIGEVLIRFAEESQALKLASMLGVRAVVEVDGLWVVDLSSARK